MERLFNKLIGYVRAIEVAGVDVIDTEATTSRRTASAPS